MKRVMKTLVILACVCALPLSYAFADDSQRGKCGMGMAGMGMPGMRHKMKAMDKMSFEDRFYNKAIFILMRSEEIKLTAEQKDKISSLKHKIMRSMTLKEAEVEVLAMDIMEALKADKVDMSAVNKLIDQKYDLKRQQAKEIAGACNDLRAILTKDQQDKVKDMWYKRMMKKMKMGEDMECKCPMMKKMMGS